MKGECFLPSLSAFFKPTGTTEIMRMTASLQGFYPTFRRFRLVLLTLAGTLLLLGEAGELPAGARVARPAPKNFNPLNPPLNPQTAVVRIEIDLSDRRLTLFYGTKRAKVFPVAVGREGWRTPVGEFQVQQMIRDPAWINPFTGAMIPGGHARNPLGRHWIGFWTDGNNWIGMHGTPNPDSVGREASHGCIRLYNEDIEELFRLVQVGTPVSVVQ